jgi:hypothetical protein
MENRERSEVVGEGVVVVLAMVAAVAIKERGERRKARNGERHRKEKEGEMGNGKHEREGERKAGRRERSNAWSEERSERITNDMGRTNE